VTASLDLRSTRLNALLLPLRSRDLDAVLAQAKAQWGELADAFECEPLVLDLRALPEAGAPLDWVRLQQGLRAHGLQPVAIMGAERLAEAEQQAAREAGLHASDDAAPPPPPAAPAPAPLPAAVGRSLVIDRPLRSGQQIYARDADLIVLGLVSHGAEVIADGHIHVYGALRGRAIAGAKGNTEARVFAQSLEAELLAIAGTFRTSEKPLPPEVLAKPAQVRLDGDRLVFEPLKY
jgi:septum site-determining protein MinC